MRYAHDMFSDAEPIPEVDAEDLQHVYEVRRKIELDNSGKQVAIGATLLEHYCKPGANIGAISLRALLLKILWMGRQNLSGQLDRWVREDGQWHDAAFRVAARFPMTWIKRREFTHADLANFVECLHRET